MELNKDGLYECITCHYKHSKNVKRNCGPSRVRRAVNFTKALVNHVLSGAELADNEEIERRFNICQTCPLYENARCKHNDCGCNILNKQKFLNKLAWKDQTCPENKW